MSVRRLLPGVAVLVGVGLVAKLVSRVLPVNHLLLAVVLGLLIANVVGVPRRLRPGVEQYDLLLEAGIVLMGAYLVFGEIADAGLQILGLVVGILTVAVLCVETLSSRVFNIEAKLSSLLASGAAICGVSAVVATAGGIEADEEHVAYAVATILVFDALTLFSYPVVGSALGLGDKAFGVWAGVSMFSTGPVTAAGFAYSDVAGTWATVTKLTRNFFLGAVVVLYSLSYARSDAADSKPNVSASLWENFPKFVVGFVFVVTLASFEILSTSHLTSLQHASKWLFVFAFAGMGTQIRASEMRRAGVRPVLSMFISLLVVATLSLLVVTLLFGS
jgi:uncharacterized integral membrane protein (TIGR00698 family)